MSRSSEPASPGFPRHSRWQGKVFLFGFSRRARLPRKPLAAMAGIATTASATTFRALPRASAWNGRARCDFTRSGKLKLAAKPEHFYKLVRAREVLAKEVDADTAILAKPDLGREIASVGSTLLGWLSGHAAAVISGATHTILNVVVALFGLYYLLLDGPGIWKRVKRLVPASDSIMDLLVSRFEEVTAALLLGTGLTASLQGFLVGIAFALLGLQPAALWGFFTACVAVLPVLGSALVWAPGAVVLFLNHRPVAAIVLAVVGVIAVSNLDNVVRLVVYRRVSGIHPMLTLVGAFAGVRMFGIVGAFVGPLMLSYFIELIGVYEDATRIVGIVTPHATMTRGS